MNIESWMEEFYPMTADAIAADEKNDDIALIEHSLLKWEGALYENTSKHDVWYDEYHIQFFSDNGANHQTEKPDVQKGFEFNGKTCALCQRYQGITNHLCSKEDGDENFCPIVRMQGFQCDDTDPTDQYTYLSTYLRARNRPERMIELLKETLNFVKQGN